MSLIYHYNTSCNFEETFNFNKVVYVPHLKVNLTIGIFIELNIEIEINMKITMCYRILDIAYRRLDIPQHERIGINHDDTYLQLQIYLEANHKVENKYNILRSTIE